jgi:hypothetical protein
VSLGVSKPEGLPADCLPLDRRVGWACERRDKRNSPEYFC